MSASEQAMSGIPLVRTPATLSEMWVQADELVEPYRSYPTHIARSVSEDEAREAVIAAARAYIFTGRGHSAILRRKLIATLNALDANP